MSILRFISTLFCRHRNATFVRNIYGDEIIERGWKRSVWRCNECGRITDRDELHDAARAVAPAADTDAQGEG